MPVRQRAPQKQYLRPLPGTLNMGRGSAVHAALIHPDGRQTPLFTLLAQDNRNFNSYFIYANDLSPGYHRVLITLNEQTTPVRELPFIVEN